MFGAFPRTVAYLAVIAASFAAQAGPAMSAGPVRSPLSAEAQADRAAVARLNVAGQGHCTATLIAPDLALTAAHCLDPRGAALQVAPGRLHVLPGWRKGAYAAHLTGRAAAVAPGWAPGRFDRDAALIRLSPVTGDPGAVAPIPVAAAPASGAAVATLSYGRDRAGVLSGQTGCRIVGREDTLILTDCEATPGVSGAPLLIETAAGPALVGLIVAAADARPPALRGAAVAVAALPLMPDLRRALARAEGEPAR